MAVSPIRLRGGCFRNVVREDITEIIICPVGSTSGTTPFRRVSIIEHGLARLAAAPLCLGSFCLSTIVGQAEFEPLRDVASASGTDIGVSVGVKHHVALITEAPIRPIVGDSKAGQAGKARRQCDCDREFQFHFDGGVERLVC